MTPPTTTSLSGILSSSCTSPCSRETKQLPRFIAVAPSMRFSIADMQEYSSSRTFHTGSSDLSWSDLSQVTTMKTLAPSTKLP